jgi:hypothetical protein
MRIVTSENFSEAFYQWCINKMIEEVSQGFTLLGQMKNPYTRMELYALKTLSRQEQQEMLETEIKRKLSYLNLNNNELMRSSIAEGDLTPFAQLSTNLKNFDPNAQDIFSEQTLNLYQEYPISLLSKIISIRLSRIFANKPKKHGNFLRFRVAISDWEIITDIDIDKIHYSYAHQIHGIIDGQKVRLADYGIYFPRYIGLRIGETWCFHNQEDIEIAAETIGNLCQEFLNFIENNLPHPRHCSVKA